MFDMELEKRINYEFELKSKQTNRKCGICGKVGHIASNKHYH